MNKILLVIEDQDTAQVFHAGLKIHGLEFVWAKTPQDGVLQLQRHTFFAAIFDLSLCAEPVSVQARQDIQAFWQVQARQPWLPLAVLSHNNSDNERLEALEQGADIYLNRPFHVKELLLNIAAFKRHADLGAMLEIGHRRALCFDDNSFTINVQQRELVLTQTEFKLFKYLFERNGAVVTKDELQRKVLNKPLGRFDRNLDMHISNTRKKLTEQSLPREWINTVRGQGYRFNPRITVG